MVEKDKPNDKEIKSETGTYSWDKGPNQK